MKTYLPVAGAESAREQQVVTLPPDVVREAIREVPATAIAPLPPFIFPRPGRAFRGVFADGHAPRLLLDLDGIL